MQFFCRHWFDVGGVLGLLVLGFVIIFVKDLTHYQLLLWLSLCALFFHQAEEYRMVRTFPGMKGRVMFKGDRPDRFPLNTHTSFVINVWVGWVSYGLAALLGIHAIWLGIATMLVLWVMLLPICLSLI